MAIGLATIANVGTFLGVLILSVPVLSLDRRKMKLDSIRRIVDRTPDVDKVNGFDQIAMEVKAEREVEATRWRPIDQKCLYAGYTLVFVSSAVRIFAA
jgi:hypothetical protein